MGPCDSPFLARVTSSNSIRKHLVTGAERKEELGNRGRVGCWPRRRQRKHTESKHAAMRCPYLPTSPKVVMAITSDRNICGLIGYGVAVTCMVHSHDRCSQVVCQSLSISLLSNHDSPGLLSPGFGSPYSNTNISFGSLVIPD